MTLPHGRVDWTHAGVWSGSVNVRTSNRRRRRPLSTATSLTLTTLTNRTGNLLRLMTRLQMPPSHITADVDTSITPSAKWWCIMAERKLIGPMHWVRDTDRPSKADQQIHAAYSFHGLEEPEEWCPPRCEGCGLFFFQALSCSSCRMTPRTTGWVSWNVGAIGAFKTAPAATIGGSPVPFLRCSFPPTKTQARECRGKHIYNSPAKTHWYEK